MNSLEYEIALRKLRQSTQAREFLPFYRNVLKPILESSVIDILSGDKTLGGEDLMRVQAYSKIIKDMEVILNRVIIQGEQIQKAARTVVARTGGSEDESVT